MHQTTLHAHHLGKSSSLTKTHLYPFGASGWVDLAQLADSIFSFFVAKKVSASTVIILQSPVARSWPFIVADAATAERSEAASRGASATTLPDGNHGEYLRSVQK